MATLDAGSMSAARQAAWNIKFLDRPNRVFAGVYSRDLRVRDLFAELHLVFDFSSSTQDLSLWPEEQGSAVLSEASPDVLDRIIDGPEPDAKPAFFVVAHHDSDACGLPGETDLALHRQEGCAKLVHPKRQQHSFYLPINQKSNDPAVTAFPFRRRGSVSPSKRSRTGSGSTSQRSQSEVTETAQHSDVVGPDFLIGAASYNEARKKQHGFRSVALDLSACCAVTKLGKSWCRKSVVGPGIHAAHIVPQLQYQLYPLGDDDAADIHYHQQQSASVPAELLVAWDRTWSVGNSIILSASIHEAFDQRLLAIHPDSHKIRVFAPYDLIIPYHGQIADFGQNHPDREALRWHWNVCAIENMGAITELLRPGLVLLPSGTEMPPSRPRQAEDDDDEGSDDGDGMGPPSAPGPANHGAVGGRKRSRLSELQGEGKEDDMPELSHGEGSSTPSFAESSSITKRQRTAAWLDSLPLNSKAY